MISFQQIFHLQAVTFTQAMIKTINPREATLPPHQQLLLLHTLQQEPFITKKREEKLKTDYYYLLFKAAMFGQ